MAKRESFLIRLDPKILSSIRKWADDEMRSVNGQIEYLLRQCASRAGRLNDSKQATQDAPSTPVEKPSDPQSASTEIPEASSSPKEKEDPDR
jgi:hypothetical protein